MCGWAGAVLQTNSLWREFSLRKRCPRNSFNELQRIVDYAVLVSSPRVSIVLDDDDIRPVSWSTPTKDVDADLSSDFEQLRICNSDDRRSMDVSPPPRLARRTLVRRYRVVVQWIAACAALCDRNAISGCRVNSVWPDASIDLSSFHWHNAVHLEFH